MLRNPTTGLPRVAQVNPCDRIIQLHHQGLVKEGQHTSSLVANVHEKVLIASSPIWAAKIAEATHIQDSTEPTHLVRVNVDEIDSDTITIFVRWLFGANSLLEDTPSTPQEQINLLGGALDDAAEILKSPDFGTAVIEALAAILRQEDFESEACPCEVFADILTRFPQKCPGRTLMINWLVSSAEWPTLLDGGHTERRIRDYTFLMELLRAMSEATEPIIRRAFVVKFPEEGHSLRWLEEKGQFKEPKTVNYVHRVMRAFVAFRTGYVAPKPDRTRWKTTGLVGERRRMGGRKVGEAVGWVGREADPCLRYTAIGG